MTFSVELIVGIVSFLLTLMVLSYLIGDNPAFRVAVYIFVGVSAGYAGAVAWHQVIWPRLIVPLLQLDLLAFIPLILSTLLLMKLSPRTAWLGNPAVAYLVGVGAAVAVGGAVMGTLFPQTWASMKALDLSAVGNAKGELLFEGVVMLIGIVATLAYFQYGVKPGSAGMQQNKVVKYGSWIGQFFIAVTFGVLFAGVFAAAMTAFIERWYFIVSFVKLLFHLS
jgi:hypothetical protein